MTDYSLPVYLSAGPAREVFAGDHVIECINVKLLIMSIAEFL